MTRKHVTVAIQAPRLAAEFAVLTSEDVADTVDSLRTTYARDTSATGVVVADGTGLRIFVKSGALVVEDGMGEHRRVRRFDKATHGLSRLLLLATTGSVSLDALSWCRRLGVGVVMLAPDGSPVLASAPRMTDDARLRRVQAQAPDQPIGMDLARWLLGRKLTAQAHLLASRFGDHDTACAIVDLASACEEEVAIDGARGIEAAAASLYWQSWSGREVRAAVRRKGPGPHSFPLDPIRRPAIGADFRERQPKG